jgi:hypothetical protein
MITAFFNILVCLLLCASMFGVFQFLLRRRGVDYQNYFLLTTGYFLTAGILTAILFWKYMTPNTVGNPVLPIALLVLYTALQTCWYLYFPLYVPRPQAYLALHPNRYYLDIHWKRLVSKSADIGAQQVFVILLVILLKSLGLGLPQTILAFGVLFGILHIPLLMVEYRRWPSLLFGAAVVVFSIIFPIMILTVPYGFVYNYLLHSFFYAATASTFWLIDKKNFSI